VVVGFKSIIAGNTRPFYKWEILLLFWFANFLNQGDRQIFNSILPLIKSGLGTNDVQMGVVAVAFTMVYGILVPIAGWLGDRASRKWIVCLGLMVFSAGTLLTGISGGLLSLILFRGVATGAGECFYTPSAYSLLSQYHHKTRALAMAINQTSIYTGIIASSWAAGYFAELFGWRETFYTFGGLGVVLAFILIARLRNDPPDNGGKHPSEAPPRIGEILGVLLRKPTAFLLSAAFGCMLFVNTGFMMWMPTLLLEKFHLPLASAAFQSVFLHHLFAFIGVLAGGWLSDRLAKTKPVARLYIGAVGLLLGAPFIFLLGSMDTLLLVYAAMAVFGLFRGVYDSNIYAALYEVIPSRYRSSATGLMTAFGYTASAGAPLILAYIKQYANLSMGMSLLAPAYLVGAALIWIAARFFFKHDKIDS